jgi:hypothetical protein
MCIVIIPTSLTLSKSQDWDYVRAETVKAMIVFAKPRYLQSQLLKCVSYATSDTDCIADFWDPG